MKKVLCGIIALAFVASASVVMAGTPDEFYGAGSAGVNFATGTDTVDVLDDNGWQGSLAFGNRIQEHVRVEAEYQYLNNDGDLDVNSIMANGYYDFGTWSNVTPYVTTGVGIGWFNMDRYDFSDNSMVYKLGAGADYAINDVWSVGARYTHFNCVDSFKVDRDQVSAVVTMKF